jgi:hypothetical protein
LQEYFAAFKLRGSSWGLSKAMGMALVKQLVRGGVILGFLILVAGCGGGDPFGYVDASGKVTYDDGSLIPAERIEVHFVPQGGAIDEKTHPRPGLAYPNVADGTYADVTSYKPGDGIVRGKHKVLVRTFDASGNELPLVPKTYTDVATTPLEVDTEQQKPPYNFTVAKPAS